MPDFASKVSQICRATSTALRWLVSMSRAGFAPASGEPLAVLNVGGGFPPPLGRAVERLAELEIFIITRRHALAQLARAPARFLLALLPALVAHFVLGAKVDEEHVRLAFQDRVHERALEDHELLVALGHRERFFVELAMELLREESRGRSLRHLRLSGRFLAAIGELAARHLGNL